MRKTISKTDEIKVRVISKIDGELLVSFIDDNYTNFNQCIADAINKLPAFASYVEINVYNLTKSWAKYKNFKL